jgi:hypothetical protein
MSNTTEPTAATPSFLEKLGAEVLDLEIPKAQAEEAYVLAFVDGEVAAGATAGAGLFVKALAAKIPVFGGVLGSELTSSLPMIDTTVDGWIKKAYDDLIALAQAKAKAWGG